MGYWRLDASTWQESVHLHTEDVIEQRRILSPVQEAKAAAEAASQAKSHFLANSSGIDRPRHPDPGRARTKRSAMIHVEAALRPA